MSINIGQQYRGVYMHAIGQIKDGAYWVYNQITTRASHASQVPAEALNAVCFTTLALLAIGLTAASLGATPRLNLATRNLTSQVDVSFYALYEHMIKTFNPHANTTKESTKPRNFPEILIPASQMSPFLVKSVTLKQEKVDYLNGNAFSGQLVRILAPLLALTLIIEAVVAIVFGTLAVVLSLASLGLVKEVNQIAVNGFPCLGFALNQLQYGLVGIFQPHLLSQRAKEPK